ncbi:HNH endonuclease [Deinococcus psychrotolerans]|uniref:HNH endonuclease n=1 Tax=Deinococcus psychrotolerans TaxID=2489213 RepID=UPI003B967BAF
MEKWGRKCAYCGAEQTPLEIEHIIPRSKGGSNRVNNLTLACVPCNQKKSSRDVNEFLAKKPEILKKILGQAKASLRDAAAVNSTRWKLYETLKSYGFPVEIGTGGRTKFNRRTQGFKKAHWIDAACVGESGEHVAIPHLKPLLIKCMERGNRKACKTDKYGFPNKWRTRQKVFFGFQTGDMVIAHVLTGKHTGVYVGRVSMRKSGQFCLSIGRDTEGKKEKKDGLHRRFFRTLQRQDGYSYGF